MLGEIRMEIGTVFVEEVAAVDDSTPKRRRTNSIAEVIGAVKFVIFISVMSYGKRHSNMKNLCTPTASTSMPCDVTLLSTLQKNDSVQKSIFDISLCVALLLMMITKVRSSSRRWLLRWRTSSSRSPATSKWRRTLRGWCGPSSHRWRRRVCPPSAGL